MLFSAVPPNLLIWVYQSLFTFWQKLRL